MRSLPLLVNNNSVSSFHDFLFLSRVDLSMSLPASTPSEDLGSGDAMGINKTGTLGPADKDRRSKKKSVNLVVF